jgi:hypothetical protein
MFLENVRRLFPQIETVPHHDTLNRVLGEIEVEELAGAHRELLERLIRKKKFRRYLIGGRPRLRSTARANSSGASL